MPEKIIVLHVPVIHKGYLDFFKRIEGEISNIYLIDEELQEELSEIKPDIASIDSKTVKELLNKIGFENILIFSKSNIEEIRGKEIVLIQNEISRNLYEKYLKGEKVEWESVFLRWDKNQVLAELPTKDLPISKEPFDTDKMKEAYKEAEKSSDWWRQIGAVLVKNRKIIARSYNQGVPNDNTPYQLGSIRDFFKAGEKQDFSPTIHAEQKLISEAAKNGIQLQGTTLYLTHFPCSVCAKLIAYSGIKNLYFSEGASNLDGKKILELVGVKITHIPQKFLE